MNSRNGRSCPGRADLELPYPWLMRNDITVRGKYMYPREAVAQIGAARPRAGVIDLGQVDLTEFGLDAGEIG